MEQVNGKSGRVWRLWRTIDQRDLRDINRTLHPETVEYTFLSSAHGRHDIPEHEASLDIFIIAETTQKIFSDHSRIKLEIDNSKLPGKSENYLKIKQYTPK